MRACHARKVRLHALDGVLADEPHAEEVGQVARLEVGIARNAMMSWLPQDVEEGVLPVPLVREGP